MEKKIKIHGIILILLSLAIITLVLIYAPTSNNQCIEANLLADIKYDGCYDANIKNIFLTIERKDNYEIRSIIHSFIDSEEREFKITNLPKYNQTKIYQFNASKNPGTIYLALDIPNIINCEEPKIVILKDCSSEKHDLSSTISSTEPFTFFDDSRDIPFQESSLLLEALVEKERIWTTICQSEWLCQDWEECEGDIQRRECFDKNKCPIPTGSPKFTRNCGNFCTENWVCTWSNCKDGFTKPTCIDQNNCGTKFTELKKLACREVGDCVPNIKCTPWSNCKINYNFNDLITKTRIINGTKIRLCEDKNNCINPKYELIRCSINMDVGARKIVRQGDLFIEIYNRLDNRIITTIKDNRDSESSSIDIYF